MRWVVIAAAGAVTIGLLLPGHAAQPDTTAPAAAKPAATDRPERGPDKISFEDYRDWRLNWNKRRRAEIGAQLAAPDLPQRRKDRLEQAKAYYDWLAGLSDTDRDRRFRERFDRIDANHDGTIDRSERAAWREKRSAFYRRSNAAQRPGPAAAH